MGVRTAVVFLTGVGIGGVAWCGLLALRPDLAAALFPPDAPGWTGRSFLPADLVFYAAAPLAAAAGLARRRPWGLTLLRIHAAAAAYAALWAAGVVLLRGADGLLALALMGPEAVVAGVLAVQLRRGRLDAA